MEILILCDKNDLVAKKVHQQLLYAKIDVAIVFAEQLAFAQSWKQLISETGECSTEIHLQDSRYINSKKLKSVFNRIKFLNMPQFLNVTDRNYAEMEMFALYVSFLKSISHALLEPIQTKNLIIEEANLFYYFDRAINAGLEVIDYHFTTSPKWQNSTDSIPIYPWHYSDHSLPLKAAHLVWENLPCVYLQTYTKPIKVAIIGESIYPQMYKNKIPGLIKFAKATGKIFLELLFVEADGKIKLLDVNDFPLDISDETINALSLLIKTKSL